MVAQVGPQNQDFGKAVRRKLARVDSFDKPEAKTKMVRPTIDTFLPCTICLYVKFQVCVFQPYSCVAGWNHLSASWYTKTRRFCGMNIFHIPSFKGRNLKEDHGDRHTAAEESGRHHQTIIPSWSLDQVRHYQPDPDC